MYWKRNPRNIRNLDKFSLSTIHDSSQTTSGEFYETELGVVLDIIMDENHPIFSAGNELHSKIDADRWPGDLEDKKALPSDKDLSWIGRALVRPVVSEKTTSKDELTWAYPIEANISEYPLINETVIIVKYGGQLYYSKKINYHNWPNNNLDFTVEPLVSGNTNVKLFSNNSFSGKVESKTNYNAASGFRGFAGKYFVANNKVRSIKRFEGDLLLESRFGQSIHFTSYDDNRQNDIGYQGYKDYNNHGGNPMILIRNRQRPLVKDGQKLIPYPKLPPIVGTSQEKNAGGYLEEDINHDGSSIHITCGQTISKFVTTCYKKMYGDGEEVPVFQGISKFSTPTLNGDQIVINTDRLILSSRYGESLHFSKKRYGIVTDQEFTVDSQDQVVITTNTKTTINSPEIYLGEYGQQGEPALLGQTTIEWLSDLCDVLINHTHTYIHSHPNTGDPSPVTTQQVIPPDIQALIALKSRLQSLLSKRVFVVGGGHAPGQNGGSIPS